jgi:hypothetical protein
MTDQIKYDPNIVTPPADIIEAAVKVEQWFHVRGINRWALAGVCDRKIIDDAKSNTGIPKEQLQAKCVEIIRLLKEIYNS